MPNNQAFKGVAGHAGRRRTRRASPDTQGVAGYPSVRPSAGHPYVRPSVCPSVRPPVRLSVSRYTCISCFDPDLLNRIYNLYMLMTGDTIVTGQDPRSNYHVDYTCVIDVISNSHM